MNKLPALCVLLFLLCPGAVRAQFSLPGGGDSSTLEIPVADDPAEALKRELTAHEELLEQRLARMQDRTRFFLERLDIRRRDLDSMGDGYAERRAALGAAPQRQAAIASLLEEVRGVSLHIARIEEEWVNHLDELAESQSQAARLRTRIDQSMAAASAARTSDRVEDEIDTIDLVRRQLSSRIEETVAEGQSLNTESDAHRDLLEQARKALRERDREMLERLTIPGVRLAPIEGPDGEVPPEPEESEEPEESDEPELSAAEREVIQLEDALLGLRVQRLERACELDRVKLARLESVAAHLRLELPVLDLERSMWLARRADLAQRAADGLLGRRPGLINAPVLHKAATHTQRLLLDPAQALDDMVVRIRPGASRAPTGRGTLLAIALVGFLSMGLVLRNRDRLTRIEPRSRGEATVLHAAQAVLPLLPVALVSFPLYALDAVPEALHPLYRFSAWAPAVVAAAVATGLSVFPAGGTKTLSASIARYARFLIRFGAAVTCIIGLINTVLPLLGYSDDVRRLLRGVSMGWILLVWLLLMVRKQEILSVIGADGEDPKEGIIKTGIRRLYRVFALGPLAVYVLYAAGYSNLAGFLVQGGLVTLAVFMLAPWVHASLRTAASNALGYPDGGGLFALTPDGARAAYRAVAPLLLLGVGLVSLLLIAAGWNSGQRIGSLPSLLTRPLFQVGGSHVSVSSLFLLALTIAAMMIVGRQVNRLLNEHVYPIYDLDRGMRTTMDTLSGYVVLMLGVVVSLDVVGLGIGFLTVFAGVIGIGVGFGSQTLAANFISGLILLFTRPVEVDDVIEVSGVTGRVVRIAPFSTVVRTLDSLDVVIPNSDLLGGTVTNWSGDADHVRMAVGVGVAYGSDVRLVERLLLEAMQAEPRVMRRPKPAVRFDGFGDSSLDFTMLPWLNDPDQRFVVASALRYSVDAAFREHDVEIPFPQRDLHLRSGDATLAVALQRGLEVRNEDGEVLAEADPKVQEAARSKQGAPGSKPTDG